MLSDNPFVGPNSVPTCAEAIQDIVRARSSLEHEEVFLLQRWKKERLILEGERTTRPFTSRATHRDHGSRHRNVT